MPTTNVQVLLDRLEHDYDFACEGGPLRNCVEWQALKAMLVAGDRAGLIARAEQLMAKISPFPWVSTWHIKFGPAIWDAERNILFRNVSGVEKARISKAEPEPQWQHDVDFVREAPKLIRDLLALVASLPVRSARAPEEEEKDQERRTDTRVDGE